ncbi:MAG: type 2 lanthipeptide synthetase LanM family protein, partial [Acidobacteriota bacterium]
DHGWVERVQKFPCKTAEEIDRFYQRQGALVTLLYVLNASDIHYENILASGEHPVLVDLETLFLPRITDRPSGSELTFLEAMKRSVLAPGILPHRGRASHGEGVTDLSGMTDGEGQKTAVPMLQAVDLATDRMRFEHVYRDIPGADNMPRLADHRVVASDYSDAICAGFERAYRLLMRHRTTLLADSGPIAAFAGCEMRLVFRPTRVYAALLFESFHPDVLRDALEREMLLDSLWHAVDEGPFMVRLLQAEKHDLLNVDVPIFNTRVDSTTLFDSQGGPIDGVIADSGLTVVRQIVAALGERDLERQLWLVRASLATLDLATTRNFERSPMVLHRDPQPAAENHLLTAADEVARALRHLAYTDSERAGWYTFEYLEHPHWTLQYAGPTLYDGLSGIALFLAHHGAVRNDTASTHFASRAIRQVLETVHRAPETLESVGAFAGRGSILYTLLHLADLWDDPLLVDAAESMVPGLLPLIERDEMHDIVGGNAGCLITLLELHSKRPSSATLAAAQACGERLLAAAQPQAKGVAWPLAAAGSQPLVGFSHGTAGVAWALLRLHAITGDRRTKATALEALAYENSLFDPLQGNWPDLREGERPGDDPDHDGHHFLNAWCHGAPGILLARLLSLPHLDTPGVRREIEAALHTTVEHGFDAGHCLCHGALGNLDILMIAGEALERPELGEQARRLATGVLDDQATSGWRYGTLGRLTPPGLLVGLAGFGYQLLRVAQPNRVPSVLALAPPRGKR